MSTTEDWDWRKWVKEHPVGAAAATVIGTGVLIYAYEMWTWRRYSR